MLTAAQLARMKATQNGNLPNQCTISRADTPQDDGMGGSIPGAPVEFTVACRIGVAGGANDSTVAEREENVNLIPITFAAGTDVRNTDQIVSGGRRFEVQSVANHDYETARQVRAIEIL